VKIAIADQPYEAIPQLLPFEQHENHHNHDETCRRQRTDERFDYAPERFNRMARREYLDEQRLFLRLIRRQRLCFLFRPVDFRAYALGKAVEPVNETVV